MTQELENILGELGMTQYLDAFLDQGFDGWDVIVDITESDLDALGVKLGHRRKLQRRIAGSRGAQPSTVVVVSPNRTAAGAGTAPALVKAESPTPDGHENRHGEGSAVLTKRKYRRHPKPDSNAPERSPSAYVLFSNKIRDDFKGQNLNFTEMAKLVGENWQSLTPDQKEPFETQAIRAKEKYTRDLAEYRKTAEFRKYLQYLQEFKQKQAQTQAKEASKRPKVNQKPLGPNKTSSGGGSGSGSGSSSDAPPARRQRVSSSVSQSGAQFALVPTPALAPSHHTPIDDAAVPPARSSHPHFDGPDPLAGPLRDVIHVPISRSSSVREVGPNSAPPTEIAGPRTLPPLSDVLDDRLTGGGGGGAPNARRLSDVNVFAGVVLPPPTGSPLAALVAPTLAAPSAVPPPMPSAAGLASVRDDPRMAALRTDSSSGSSSFSLSGSAAASTSGTSVSSRSSPGCSTSVGSVPIHALLLTSGTEPAAAAPSYDAQTKLPSSGFFAHRPCPSKLPPTAELVAPGYPGPVVDSVMDEAPGSSSSSWPASATPRYPTSLSISPMSDESGSSSSVQQQQQQQQQLQHAAEMNSGLDRMSVLVRAGEIVARTTP